ncbi:MAG: cysteine synthase CysM [Alcanivoracaceae bacterium]|nr:cysteine synthase CysM [Alcanivoracaceae bacterium]
MKKCQTLESTIGNTPLIRIQRLYDESRNNLILAKLEGQNPAGSVKDRPALSMIKHAENKGNIQPGDRLVEATSGNTGIALAMIAALKGYKITLIMPKGSSMERQKAMTAYGAQLILVSDELGMEGARDLAIEFDKAGKAILLNQFANQDNPLAHYESTGREIWRDTEGEVTHFISAMGTTGTIMGTSCYLKKKNIDIQIIGVQPDGESKIPGIRRWSKEYLPKIFDPSRVDKIIDVSQNNARKTTRLMAQKEGIFAGPSSGGTMYVALKMAQKLENAVIVAIVCDRGDRYLSTDLFD